MARISEKDWSRWVNDAGRLLLRRASSGDWLSFRKERGISVEKLAELQRDAKAEIARSVRVELDVEFQRARDSIEETKQRMDRVFKLATDGIPVVCEDEESYQDALENAQQVVKGLAQAVAASNVRLQADKALIGLLGLVAPSGESGAVASELEEAVSLHLVPLQLADANAPASEHIRLAASKILELLAARPAELKVVG